MNNQFKILVMALILSLPLTVFGQTKVIAHRGYWNCEGAAQNSIVALHEAQRINAYGSEFDVLITADGVAVVNHDDVVSGMDIQTTSYDKLKNVRLKNGERLSLLEEYLIHGKMNTETQLILEIKPHKTKEAEDKAVATVLELVRKHGLESQVEYISFSLYMCEELVRLSPNSKIQYLRGELSPKELKAKGITGLDYHYNVFKENPTWIKEAKALGLTVNVWTVNDLAVMESMIQQGVDFVTTDKPMEVQKLLNVK